MAGAKFSLDPDRYSIAKPSPICAVCTRGYRVLVGTQKTNTHRIVLGTAVSTNASRLSFCDTIPAFYSNAGVVNKVWLSIK